MALAAPTRRALASLLAVALTALALPGAASAAGASLRIVGGSTTSLDDHPWQVWVTSSDARMICGGSILDANHVITAAHCVEGAGPLQVGYGGVSLSAIESAGAFTAVGDAEIDPRRNAFSDAYDSAVLTLATPIPVTAPAPNRAIEPATAAAVATAVGGGAAAGVSGWGSTSALGNAVNLLRAVTVPLVSDSACATHYPGAFVAAVMLCAGATGKDTCYGDSGGPLVILDGGVPKLAGLTSFGPEDSCGDVPGVYAEVSEAGTRSFILAAMGAPAEPEPPLTGDPPPVTPQGSGGPASIPSAPALDTRSPSARIRKVSCRRGLCTIALRATDASGIHRVGAKLTWTTRGRRRTRSLRAKARGAGNWTVKVRLRRGRYRLTMTAVDWAGNRRTVPPRSAFRVR